MEKSRSYKLLEGTIIACHRPDKNLLKKLSNELVNTVVTLLWNTETPEEVYKQCESLNINWISFPVKSINYTLLTERHKCSAISEKLFELKDLLMNGQKLLIHCAAGIHRTGFVTYNLLRLCGHSKEETITALGIIRPKILEKISSLRLEISESFSNMLINGIIEEIPYINTLGMIETDWIKPAIFPILWIKVIFCQDIAKISFCVTSGNLEKMIVGSEVFMRIEDEFSWKTERLFEITGVPKIRTKEECDDIVSGLLLSSTKKGTSRIGGTSCFFDKEFLYKYMPNVIKASHYRIIDISTLNLIQHKQVNQSSSIYDDINQLLSIKSSLTNQNQ